MEDSKIISMLKSGDKEMVELAMNVLKQEYPAVYSGIMNLSGLGDITDEILARVSTFPEVQIGTKVRYRGLPGAPEMVVTNAKVDTMRSPKFTTYYITITAKYFNKSKQDFATTSDRLEVFEMIPSNNTTKIISPIK